MSQHAMCARTFWIRSHRARPVLGGQSATARDWAHTHRVARPLFPLTAWRLVLPRIPRITRTRAAVVSFTTVRTTAWAASIAKTQQPSRWCFSSLVSSTGLSHVAMPIRLRTALLQPEAWAGLRTPVCIPGTCQGCAMRPATRTWYRPEFSTSTYRTADLIVPSQVSDATQPQHSRPTAA